MSFLIATSACSAGTDGLDRSAASPDLAASLDLREQGYELSAWIKVTPAENDPTKLIVSHFTGACSMPGRALAERRGRAVAEEFGDRVVVTLYLEAMEPGEFCEGEGVPASTIVRIDEPIGGRRVLDGACELDPDAFAMCQDAPDEEAAVTGVPE